MLYLTKMKALEFIKHADFKRPVFYPVDYFMNMHVATPSVYDELIL